MKSFVIIVKGHENSERFGTAALQSAKDQGWSLERYDAVDGRKIKNQTEELEKYGLFLDTRKRKQVSAMSRPGVFGNFLTHWNLWNLCVELNEPIGIFEHDVIFVKPPEIDFDSFDQILRLGWIQKQKDYLTGECFSGAHAYIIKPKGATKLLKWGKSQGVICADALMGTNVVNMVFDHSNKIIFNPETKDSAGNPLHSTSRGSTF